MVATDVRMRTSEQTFLAADALDVGKMVAVTSWPVNRRICFVWREGTRLRSRDCGLPLGEKDGEETEARASGRDSTRRIHEAFGPQHEQAGSGPACSGHADRRYRGRTPGHHRRYRFEAGPLL